MSDRKKNKEKPSETGSSQQESNPAEPQGYDTAPIQKECNKSKPPSYGTILRTYAENTKNIITIEQPLNKDK